MQEVKEVLNSLIYKTKTKTFEHEVKAMCERSDREVFGVIASEG